MRWAVRDAHERPRMLVDSNGGGGESQHISTDIYGALNLATIQEAAGELKQLRMAITLKSSNTVPRTP